MAKKMQFLKFLIRVGFNVSVAAVILALLSGVLTSLAQISPLVAPATVLATAWLVFTIFKARPGPETLMAIVLGIPAGIAVIQILTGLFNISLPVLQSSAGILSSEFLLLLASYYAADWAFIKFFRKR